MHNEPIQPAPKTGPPDWWREQAAMQADALSPLLCTLELFAGKTTNAPLQQGIDSIG